MVKLLTTGEIAKVLNVCRETVGNWIKQGKIQPFAIAQNRQFFTIEQLEKIKALNNQKQLEVA